MDPKAKDLLTANTVFLVRELSFDRLRDQLLSHEVLPYGVINTIMMKHSNNVERIQLMLVELRKSANTQTYHRFLLALNSSGYPHVTSHLEPNFIDGKPFFEASETNNNQNNAQGFFSQQLRHNIQPAIFHHVPQQQPTIANIPADTVTPGLLHTYSDTMASLPESFNGGMDVEMTDEDNGGTVAEYGVVLDVHVQTAPEFIVSDENYRMNSRPKGLCLIVNNVDFNHGPTGRTLMETRDGSNHDAKVLSMLFEQLGYKIEMYKNLPARGDPSMKSVIKNFSSSEELKQVDSAVVILLSHGKSENLIYGTDAETVSTERILKCFNNENCPNLLGKPKMFFIQACRGTEIDRGVPANCVHDSPAGPLQSVSLTRRDSMEDRIPRTSTWSDMMIAYSTCPGFVSIRNRVLGSWFCQAIVRIFMARAHNTHIQDMMNLVSREMIQSFETVDGEKQSIELVFRSWVKKLNFNPGRYED